MGLDSLPALAAEIGDCRYSGSRVMSMLYENKLYGAGPSSLVGLVTASEVRVLEIGCGNGETARALTTRGHVVTAVTSSPLEARVARDWCDEVYVADVESWDCPRPPRTFDALVLSHVIEHLVTPLPTLIRLAGLLRPGGSLYLATPNIAFWKVRLALVFGRFEYSDTGIMDRTHLRFFTRESARALVQNAGFAIRTEQVTGWLPLGPARRLLGSKSAASDRLATRWAPSFFGHEILVAATLTDAAVIADRPV